MSKGGEGDDGQEKTEDPTQQKLDKAREDGDVPQSKDVAAAATYLGLLLFMLLAAGWASVEIAGSIQIFIAQPDQLYDRLVASGGGELSLSLLMPALIATGVMLIVPLVSALLAVVAQQSFVVSTKKLEPKLSKISPISNAKQKYGMDGIVEFLKTFVKMSAVCGVLAYIIIAESDQLAGIVNAPARALPIIMKKEGLLLLSWVTVVSIAIAAADFFWQKHSHTKKLRMSFQEQKEEVKESEGDPYIKAQRQQRGREIAMNQMLEKVPQADVVITNPTHYAVALKWERKPGAAPIVVAKGVDEIAAKIREIATENNVPLHRDPPTARAIFATVDLDAEIRIEQYAAVAAAIRFADEIRQKKRS